MDREESFDTVKKERIMLQKMGFGRFVRFLPALSACTGHAIWGFSYLFTRLALQVTQPDILLSIRFLISFAIVNLLILTGRAKVSFRGKKWKPLILLGIAEPLYFYFESYGIFYTNATFAGVMIAVVPVVSLLSGALFLKEYPSRRQAIFCFLPVVGVIMITVSTSALGIVRPIGVALLMCTVFASVFYKTVNRKSAEEYTSFERTYVILLVSSAVFTLMALRSVNGSLHAFLMPLFHMVFLIPVLILSIFCSVAANMLVNYAAGKMSVVKLSVFGSITTICSMFAGVLFLHEPITVVSLTGSLLIIIGIHQVTKEREKEDGKCERGEEI